MTVPLTESRPYSELATPDFTAFVAACTDDLRTRQQNVEARWHLTTFRLQGFDQDTGIVRFVNATGEGIRADGQILGSYDGVSGTWEWGWNNPTVDAERRRDAYAVRALGFAQRFAPLTTSTVRVTVGEARALMTVAASVARADSVIQTFMSERYAVAIAVRNFAATAKAPAARAATAGSSGFVASLRHYVRDPIVLARMGSKPGDANRVLLPSLDDAAIPEILREYLRMSEQRLIAGGFRPPVYTRSREEGNVNSVAALLEHPDDGALGFTHVGISRMGKITAVTAFATYFADGWKLSTSNSPTVIRTPSQPKVDGARFANVLDTRALYELHRRRVRGRAAKVDIVPTSRGADPLRFLDDESRQTHAFWIRKGYYRAVEGDRIQLTALGAILSAWRGLYPWKQLTERRMDRKSAAILKQLGIRITRKECGTGAES
jgi:hypothetical protein